MRNNKEILLAFIAYVVCLILIFANHRLGVGFLFIGTIITSLAYLGYILEIGQDG